MGKENELQKQEGNLSVGGENTFNLFFHTKNFCKFSRDVMCHHFESSDANASG